MNYFILAGEASGDLHAAGLIMALRREDPSAAFSGMGGSRMAEAGCSLYQDYREMAYMGFAAVLRNLHKVHRNFRIAHEALLREQPDVLILIDYPSFNLRIAEWCRRHLPNTKIVYYIPPKIWAWKTWRVHRIGQLCDLILGIFPFEEEFYARYGYTCHYVGNPSISSGTGATSNTSTTGATSIAVLPGSRLSEVQHCLPTMLAAALRIEGMPIHVAMAPGIDETCYRTLIANARIDESRLFLTRDTCNIIAHARVAIVNSGTATLETALIGTPQVAVYHLACSRLIGWLRPLQRYLFHIPYFTLVNILAGREVIRELIANDFTTNRVEAEVRRILSDHEYEKRMRSGYEHIRQILGNQDAATTAAQTINQMAASK